MYRNIPNNVLALLHERIVGFDELKALLLVRSDASKIWTASSVAESLGLSASWSEAALENLCAGGLLVGNGQGLERQFSYRPVSTELESTVTSLAAIYGYRRIDVMRILSSKAMNRIRWAAVQAFASALVFRAERKAEGEEG